MSAGQKLKTNATGLASIIDQLVEMSRFKKRALVVLLDAALCVLATWIAYYLRLGEFRFWPDNVLKLMAGSMAFWFVAAAMNGVYRQVFRYAGTGSMLLLARSVAVMSLPMIALFLIVSVTDVPRTLSVLQPLVLFLLLALSRIAIRQTVMHAGASSIEEGEKRRILIYGAGDAGQSLASSIQSERGMRLMGFIDDDERKPGHRINLTTIYPSTELNKLVRELSITDIFLAMPNISRSRRASIMAELAKNPVRVMILPAMREIISGEVTTTDLRDVEIVDLLGRSQIKPDADLMAKNIVGYVVMVTGAGGSIGSELCRQIISCNPAAIILVEQSEFGLYSIDRELSEAIAAEKADIKIYPELANVADKAATDRIISNYRPTTIFHAAAYKHVPLVEANVISGARNNIIGTYNVLESAKSTQVANVILISTDKAVRPTNIMGATKRICEQIFQAYASQKGISHNGVFAMVRFGNVLGSSGSVVPLFKRQIRNGGPITLTDKRITRYFMTIPEAAELVIQAGAMADGGEVFVLDMGESIKIIDLAYTLTNLSGLSVRDGNNPDGDIEIIEIGLRPGEKLYEELLIGGSPETTEHERIMLAKEDFMPWDRLHIELEKLALLLNAGNSGAVRELIAELVPEYTPDEQSSG